MVKTSRNRFLSNLKNYVYPNRVIRRYREQRTRQADERTRELNLQLLSKMPQTDCTNLPYVSLRDDFGELQEVAERAHILVAITFHFVEHRLGYLEEVLRSLIGFPVRGLYIVVYTNTRVPGERFVIQQTLSRAGLEEGLNVEIVLAEGLRHPFELTWCHKPLITNRFFVPDSEFTHFIYLEDDERLTFENFVYFITAREMLRSHNLLPAFVRTEWSAASGSYVSTDSLTPVTLDQRPFIRTTNHAFINLDSPYSGAFILDRDIAREYILSPSFYVSLSRSMSSWEIRERAAMGMTFEAPPEPFPFRVAVPVVVDSGSVPRCAWIAHLPNNYANDPTSGLGKVAMDQLIIGKLSS